MEKVAILVLPRDHCSRSEACLEHLYAFTDVPFQVIVIDCFKDKQLSARLKRWEEKYPNCKVLRTDRYVMPDEAKNLALKQLPEGIEWIVLLDNDVKVGPKWLSWMLKAAEETGARAIHPLYLIEQNSGVSIHMADGEFKKISKSGSEWTQPVMRYVGENIINVPKFKRQKSAFVEFHCCMLRRDLVKQLGDFEPIHLAEDMHFSLLLEEIGEKIIFEPNSVITYVIGSTFEKSDIEYFQFRRSLKAGEQTLEYLKKRWPQMMPGYWEGKLAWLHYHRSRITPFHAVISKVRRRLSYSRAARTLAKMIPAVRGA